ncbi:MAG TPA: hypothetical protein VM345_03590 [Acidimicrobiales bacterium]|jgi:hypothetical protein|nr:hypothetical protein [Acidimicrobiales bacterium]
MIYLHALAGPTWVDDETFATVREITEGALADVRAPTSAAEVARLADVQVRGSG